MARSLLKKFKIAVPPIKTVEKKEKKEEKKEVVPNLNLKRIRLVSKVSSSMKLEGSPLKRKIKL